MKVGKLLTKILKERDMSLKPNDQRSAPHIDRWLPINFSQLFPVQFWKNFQTFVSQLVLIIA